MILSAQTLDIIRPLQPWHPRTVFEGMTFGLGPAGYDVRIAEDVTVEPGGFVLASTMEEFNMSIMVLGYVKDKSTWARRGLAVQNTVIEPGWRGFLTLELTNHSKEAIAIRSGMPIAQIVFHQLDAPTQLPYAGKYQDQVAGPVDAKMER